jgi:hypothetical protein
VQTWLEPYFASIQRPKIYRAIKASFIGIPLAPNVSIALSQLKLDLDITKIRTKKHILDNTIIMPWAKMNHGISNLQRLIAWNILPNLR